MYIFTAVVIITLLFGIITLSNFLGYFFIGRVYANKKFWKVIQIWTVLIMPAAFLYLADLTQTNNCCTDSAVFSPEHRLGIYTLIILYTIAFIVGVFRKHILPPIAELLLNSFLILGLILNILFCIHFTIEIIDDFIWVIGNIPIIMLLLLMLAENQNLLKYTINEANVSPTSKIGKFCIGILNLSPIYKYPILTIILVPIVIIISLIFILFGQQADSIIRAFTDTYKHGFSQLDHECHNVDCGGHFLCSVGANGHKSIVKPIRYGERKGKRIICNRQLLISNAFEDLIKEKLPGTHKVIRHNYNKVGKLIHKYYSVFNIKIVSDIIYILMKPLELVLLFTLYLFDKKPENRIAMQYLNHSDRLRIENHLHR